MLVVFLLNEKQTRRNMGGELEPSEETKRNMKEKSTWWGGREIIWTALHRLETTPSL